MPAPQKINYQHTGPYDRVVFQEQFTQQFGASGRYNAAAIPDMLSLLGMIERDTAINDVRQAAYMLATVMWETTSPVTVTKVATNKKGQPLVDKHGQPVVLKQKKWLMTMAPVAEIGHGKGRQYHEPVKVKLLPDGGARITEQDGDQFSVTAAGDISPLTKGAKMGTKDGGAATKSYDADDGIEQAYYGRGYVQLTWWSNYAKAGVALGRGLGLLTDPEQVKTPETAYALMSYGMRTGGIFANGRKFSLYFSGDATDYVSARKMVNGSDHAEDIAKIARKFEAVLLKARPNAITTPATPKP
ncbi:glycoside hydrolase [Paracidovorax avenae]|uniref:glycoside hydrolase n=1 Tax=Paracidovorax avenae TaxID=80867 RepID=UPI000D2194A3|nr:glycoside hydrolase [Paracidovorax avenae]AVT11645.1 glycoside hydrolase [Paracidovorax avenae]